MPSFYIQKFIQKEVFPMNNKRRDLLRDAINLVSKAQIKVESARDQEQECFDNLPENLKDYDKGVIMEEAVDALDDAIDSLEKSVEYINKAM